MDLYTILKFLHVVLAIIWLGGAGTGAVYGLWAWRRGTVADMDGFMRREIFMSSINGPASLGVLALGLWMAWQYYDFGQAWIVLALLGLLVHFGVGFGVVMKRFMALAASVKEGRLAEADRPEFGKVMRLGLAHNVLVYTIVLDMVAKPDWGDVGLILLMVLIVALGFAQALLAGRSAKVT